MKRYLFAAAALAACSAMAACSNSYQGTADQQAAAQQENIAQRAQSEVGIYQPTNFTRKRLANRIGQMLDSPNLATVSYAQGMDGKLRCIGHSIGFPYPAATQTTSPQRLEYHNSGYVLVPQAEPDQLFSPAAEDATWVMLVNKQGVAAPAYFEGHVQAFLPANKPDASLIAQDCAG
jgi:hypothetical protein